jgi:hypothetical protein
VFAVAAVAGDGAWWERLGFAALTLACGAIVVIGATTLRRDAPMVVLRDEGIEHRWMGLIPWDDVKEVQVHVAAGNPLLGLELRDATRYVARIPWLPMRLFARINPLFRYPTLSLPLSYLELSAEELVAEMELRARRPLRRGTARTCPGSDPGHGWKDVEPSSWRCLRRPWPRL